MSRCKWSLLSLVFVIMAPPSTGDSRAVVVQLNRNALLPCEANTMRNDDCHDVSWTFRRVNTPYEVTLVKSRVVANLTLTLLENCVLLIRNVVEEDAGQYVCRHSYTEVTPVSLFVLKGEDPSSVSGLSEECSLISPEPRRFRLRSFPAPTQERWHDSANSTINALPILHCRLVAYDNKDIRNFIFEGRAPTTTIVPYVTTASNNASPFTNDCKQVLYAVIAAFVAALLTLVCVTVLCWRRKAKPSQSDNCHFEEEHCYATVHFDKEMPNRGTEAEEEEEEVEEVGDLYTRVVYSAARTAPPPVQTDPSALYATVYKP